MEEKHLQMRMLRRGKWGARGKVILNDFVW